MEEAEAKGTEHLVGSRHRFVEIVSVLIVTLLYRIKEVCRVFRQSVQIVVGIWQENLIHHLLMTYLNRHKYSHIINYKSRYIRMR